VSGIVSSASDGKHGALPLTLRQRGYDGARIEYVNSANQNATKYATDVNQANRETGDRMASISVQQGKEAAGAAYGCGLGPPSLDTGRHKASTIKLLESNSPAGSPRRNHSESGETIPARLQAFSAIISRMGAKLAQDIEKGMEMRY